MVGRPPLSPCDCASRTRVVMGLSADLNAEEPCVFSSRALEVRLTLLPFPSPPRSGFDRGVNWPSAPTCTVVARGAPLICRLARMVTVREWTVGATALAVPLMTAALPRDPVLFPLRLACNASAVRALSDAPEDLSMRLCDRCSTSAACAVPSSPSCGSDGSVA